MSARFPSTSQSNGITVCGLQREFKSAIKAVQGIDLDVARGPRERITRAVRASRARCTAVTNCVASSTVIASSVTAKGLAERTLDEDGRSEAQRDVRAAADRQARRTVADQ